MTTVDFPAPVIILFHDWLGCISLNFGSQLVILYDQYREIGQKPSGEFRNIRSDLLALILLDDLVRKLTRPCSFYTCKYKRTSAFFRL